MKPLIVFSILFLFLQTAAFSQNNGTMVFDESYMHKIEINFEQTNFWDSLEYYYDDFFYNHVKIKYMMASVLIDGDAVDSIGVRQKGFYSNWGAWTDKKPLKLKFNKYVKGQKYDGLKKINLQNGFSDPSMMRDVLSYKFMRDIGIAAPRTSYAKVFLNGDYWGLYIIVEQIDKKFLKNWFDVNDGDLFKCIAKTNLDWLGNSQSYYTDVLKLKTNKNTSDFTDLIKLIDVINNSGSNFKDSLANHFETAGYLKILAADVIMLNWDSYYNNGRNFYIYQNPENNKFNWIPWDYNFSLSNVPSDIIIDYSQLEETDPKPLVVNIQNNNLLKNAYFENLCNYIDNYFNLENLEGYIDGTAQLIRQAYADDTNKFFTIDNFDTSIQSDIEVQIPEPFSGDLVLTLFKGVKQFIAERNTTILQQLVNEGYVCDTADNIKNTMADNISIYPNPAGSFINIELGGYYQSKINSVVIIDLQGKQVLSRRVNLPITTVDCSVLHSGVYLCKVVYNNGVCLKRIIIEK